MSRLLRRLPLALPVAMMLAFAAVPVAAQETQEAEQAQQESEQVQQDAEVAPAATEPGQEETGPEGTAADPQEPEATSDAEEEALRLVEQILAEQQQLLSGQNFVYRSEGRRDPFRNLLQLRQRELDAPAQRPAGLPGFLVGEVQVTAVAQFQGRWQALLVGLDRRTYTAGVGAELYDGRIIEINATEVIFEQEVQDLIGARSTRQVVRKLNNGNQE